MDARGAAAAAAADPGTPPRPRPRSVRPWLINLEPDTPPEHIFRDLVGAYVSGTPKVAIRQRGGARVATRAVVGSFQQRLPTGGALAEEDGALVLQDLDREVAPPLGGLVFHLGESTLELLREAGSAGFSSDMELDWHRRDDALDSMAWEVERRVRQAWLAPREGTRAERIDPIRWLGVAHALERIGDHAVLVAVHGAQWRETESTEAERRLLAEIHRQAWDYLASALVLLADPRMDTANAALDIGEALRATVRTLVDRLLAGRSGAPPPPLAVVSLGWVLHSLDRVVAYSMDIIELALDSARSSRPLYHSPSNEDNIGGKEGHE